MNKEVISYKDKRKNERLQEVARKKRIRNLMLATGAILVVVIIVFAVIQANQPTKGIAFDYANQPVLGQANAPVKVVEFGDLKCPQCKAFETNIYPQFKKDYIDTGKVQLYFINDSFIPGSMTPAIAGESIFHQNKDAFWPFYEAIYQNQGEETADWATSDYLVNLAKTEKLPIDFDLLKKDIDNQVYDKTVKADNALANKVHVIGTPTLFINGKIAQFDEIMNYTTLKGLLDNASK
ncbi:MAG: bdbD [Bacilli bacterium]|nr:bdbD [Bacilli bacterium]